MAQRAEIKRCSWCSDDPLYIDYHDHEWGVPIHDDRALFEMLCLEGAQAGLSWLTILKKREGYRQLFFGFEIAECARLSDDQLEERLLDASIVRNRLKVFGIRKNAIAALALLREHGSFDAFIWSFVDGTPIVNRWKKIADCPTVSPEAAAMSKALKKRGMTFVGPTICYAFMQATGMVDDHMAGCWRAVPRRTGVRH